jgi:acyl-coenzyme A thioesterase PaaI-like protein
MDPESLKAAGWMRLESVGFTGVTGPFWMQGASTERLIGLLAEPRHGNNHVGTVHGGVLMTFADICLGYGAAEALGDVRCVTAHLQLHFVSSARIGEFITCRPELVRCGSQLIFMRGLVMAGERIVANADGIWKVLKQG